jgi:transposase-like protein
MTIAFVSKCIDCSKQRFFTQYDMARDRHLKERCQPCSVKAYNATRIKQDSSIKKQRMKEYYQKNKQQMDENAKEWRLKKRLELIVQAGGKCQQCGIDDPIVLDFDHIKDDGAEHRKQTKRANVVNILSKQGLNKDQFQLLCKNCNWKKEYFRRKNNAEHIRQTA